MNKFLSIQDAAKCLGVSPQTLRRWEKKNKIAPSHRTEGGQRRYSALQLQPISCRHNTSDRLTIAYARVSSHDQKEDLQRQVHMLEIYCASKGWSFSITKNLGSGMNYNKRGLTAGSLQEIKDDVSPVLKNTKKQRITVQISEEVIERVKNAVY